jgi:hypothetical protein
MRCVTPEMTYIGNRLMPGPIHRLCGPYAASHDALDEDVALHEEVRNAAHALITQIAARRAGQAAPDEDLKDPKTEMNLRFAVGMRADRARGRPTTVANGPCSSAMSTEQRIVGDPAASR